MNWNLLKLKQSHCDDQQGHTNQWTDLTAKHVTYHKYTKEEEEEKEFAL